MVRARFYANIDDPRPINWPIKHPYWVSGYAGDESYAIVVAYADGVEYIQANWPEATNIEILEETAQYRFTDRFPKPDWFK